MSEMQAVKGKVWKSIDLNKAAVKSQKRFPTAVLFGTGLIILPSDTYIAAVNRHMPYAAGPQRGEMRWVKDGC